jgi:hypothetical protein
MKSPETVAAQAFSGKSTGTIFSISPTYEWIIIAISILICLAVFIFYISRKRKIYKKDFLDASISRSKQHQKELKKKLIKMLWGDKKAAERLINAERGRMPDNPEIKFIQMAIERLARDRR